MYQTLIFFRNTDISLEWRYLSQARMSLSYAFDLPLILGYLYPKQISISPRHRHLSEKRSDWTQDLALILRYLSQTQISLSHTDIFLRSKIARE